MVPIHITFSVQDWDAFVRSRLVMFAFLNYQINSKDDHEPIRNSIAQYSPKPTPLVVSDALQ